MAPTLSMITIPAQTAEQLKLVVTAAAFGYVGSTLASDVVDKIRRTKPGRRTVRVSYPSAAFPH